MDTLICGKCVCIWEDQREESNKREKGWKKEDTRKYLRIYVKLCICVIICISERITIENKWKNENIPGRTPCDAKLSTY